MTNENLQQVTGPQGPKERSNTDRIMFQNQSHLVENYFNHQEIKADLYDICLATDLMVEYTKWGSKHEQLKDRFVKFQSYIQNKYASKNK